MSRETSPYVVGDYWIDKRRDGKSPDIWQIATYSAASRSDVYRSTRTADLERAKVVIHAYVEAQRAKKLQPVDAAEVIPQLLLYWREHGSKARKPATIAGSLRAFIGFLLQDELGPSAKMADLLPRVFIRFQEWRMAPHSFTIPWEGKHYPLSSAGVSGEAVQRNLDDIRAALNHSAKNGRVPYAPRVPSVALQHRSPARDVRVPIKTLGAMVGFAQAGGEKDRGFLRWLLLMIASAARPEASLAFDPRHQWGGGLMMDTHPPAWPRTKKRNPIIPAVRPFRPILRSWQRDDDEPVLSRKRAWNTMRGALGLDANVIPKVIRHTIATELRSRGVSGEQISGLLGHQAMHRTTEVYAKYDPNHLVDTRRVLTMIFREVLAHRRQWLADHLRTTGPKGKVIVVARDARNG